MAAKPKKLYLHLLPALLAVALLALGLVALGGYGFLDRLLLKGQKENLETQAKILAQEFDYLLAHGKVGVVDARCDALGLSTGYRYTVVLADGRVVGDSAVGEAARENHLGRPEVQKALSGATALDFRRSASTGQKYLFLAVPLHYGGATAVLRVAKPFDSFRATLRTVYFRFLVGVLLVLGAVLLFSLKVSRQLAWRLIRPLERLLEFLRGVRDDGAVPCPPDEEEGPSEYRELREGVLSATDRLSESIGRERKRGRELERKAGELERLAHYDVLTGLPNRAMLYEALDAALGRAKREGTCLGVLFFDLDRFKEVNDTLGHDKGDLLLRAVAERLEARVRSRALVARLGGDEFCALAEDLDGPREAASLARDILKAMERPFEVRGPVLEMSVSIGISLYPRDGKTRGELLHAADTAMYEAKRGGRAAFSFAGEGVTAG